VTNFFISCQQNYTANSSIAARAYGEDTTTDLVTFLDFTSRDAMQSAFLSVLECILISKCDDTFEVNIFIFYHASFHIEIGLALHKLISFWKKPEYIGLGPS